MNNKNYEYCYYNYDIGTYINDNKDSNKKTIDFIKSSICLGLKKQMVKIAKDKNGKEVFDKFQLLMSDEDSLIKLEATLTIKTNFGTTQTFTSTVDSIFGVAENIKLAQIKLLENTIYENLVRFDTYCLLCIDYLWRLAQYLANPKEYRKCMYVCYDNLDSITDFDVLCNFKDQLIYFRKNLSEYISNLNRNIRMEIQTYGVKSIAYFVIFTTYRKITAIRSSKHNIEMLDDTINNTENIRIIEVSKQYNFTSIAQKRIIHFTRKLRVTNICGKNADKLIKQMNMVSELKKMLFVKTRYAGLWNYNLRSCSNVLSELIVSDQKDIKKCINLYKMNIDGHIQEKYCYYGASSLFLQGICRLLNRLKIFDSNHLDLINIKEDTQKNKTSFSRLLITYFYTKNESVSITEIFSVFDKVFDPKYICKILGHLLTRVSDEIWRRPIYYSKHAIDNETDIENKLYNQYKKYQNHEEYNYVEFKICDCGKTYINSIVPHFEFYSIRINENYPSLYCIDDPNELNKIIGMVYEKIQICCTKQIEFAEEYIEKYQIDKGKYVALPFHPRTRLGNPQLHIERVIFSHIAYFNSYRMYLLKKRRTTFDKLNEILIQYINDYLNLYRKYVVKISTDRDDIASKMTAKVRIAKTIDKSISIDA